MNWPEKLQTNAFASSDINNEGDVAPDLRGKLLQLRSPEQTLDLAPTRPDLTHWWDDRVGWGLVLPDDLDLPHKLKAGLQLTDPSALHRLVAHRQNAPVYRYAPNQAPNTLTRYYDNGGNGFKQEISFEANKFGTGRGDLPRYLLIFGSPSEIPWSLQYVLQATRFVGRLDLTGAALKNYVGAICNDWYDSEVDNKAMTLWSVAHDPNDITELMLNSVGKRLFKAFADDGDYAPSFFSRDEATLDALHHSLVQTRPGLVATTSHGMTGPLHDVIQMQAQLGLLVDQKYEVLKVKRLLENWQPDGAVWYAHACCSAGSSGESEFLSYVAPGSGVFDILKGVAACGSMISPLPQALLGAQKPLRAFIGHVEPTFNWTLMRPSTGQYLTNPIIELLYTGLYSGATVGLAFENCRLAMASLATAFIDAKNDNMGGEDKAGEILRLQLTARDWRSLVLLGDPAVTLHGLSQRE